MSSPVIVLDKALILSKPWFALNGVAKTVYLIFRTKLVISKRGTAKRKGFIIVNNGEIEFSYNEAETKYGITRSTFGRALDDLIGFGFIDVTASGMGIRKVTTYYAISDRWQDWGTSNFREVHRPKSNIANPGFKRGNTLWQRAKTKSSVKSEHGSVRTSEHGEIMTMRTSEHGQKMSFRYKCRRGKWLATKIA